MADSIRFVSETLLGCVSGALEDDLRPVCSSYHALGTPVILQCCECDEGSNGELSIHLQRVYDADSQTLDEVQRVRPCRGGVTAAHFRIVLARCKPIIDERGEMPSHDVITQYAEDQMRDVDLLWGSLVCCADFPVRVDDVSVDLSEPGTCSLIYADVTVEVRVPPPPPSLSESP